MSPRLLSVVAAAFAVSVVVDLGAGVSPPGRYAAAGFFGCLLIVVVSKQAGKRLLLRPEGSRPGDIADVDNLAGPDANGARPLVAGSRGGTPEGRETLAAEQRSGRDG